MIVSKIVKWNDGQFRVLPGTIIGSLRCNELLSEL